MVDLYADAKKIIAASLDAALPDVAVKKALRELPQVTGKIVLIAIGKAAWQMAAACVNIGEYSGSGSAEINPEAGKISTSVILTPRQSFALQNFDTPLGKGVTPPSQANNLIGGVIITKYGHVGKKGKKGKKDEKGNFSEFLPVLPSLPSLSGLSNIKIFEAGHPVPDENSYAATEAAIKAVSNLHENDLVLFLISGGGSSLFEKPLIPAKELESITHQLLKCGANIVEMNIIRKRLSAVKGGRFAQICAPAKVFSVVLSDIIGDPLDMIASGPAYPDSSTSAQAFEIVQKYGLAISHETEKLLAAETPKVLNNVTTRITGSVRELCIAAREKCRELGYTPFILTDSLNCTARDAGSFLASIARFHRSENTDKPLAFIAGGETIVKITGTGKGGRNQEIALAAADGIAGLTNVAIFSIGSDGTDGPTDAAGGYVTGETRGLLLKLGLTRHLDNNDAYHALEAVGGLIKTGPTGTNVNDLSVVLLRP